MGLAAAVGAIAVVLAVGQGGWRLRHGAPADEDTGYVQRDDDRFWHLAGTVYANRADPAVWVSKRAMGVGWTMNVGHPAGLAIACVLLAVIAVLAGLGIWGLLPEEGPFYGWELRP
ncbi:hypothetical protein GCM10022205_23790 [Spinactinospora alkalitolerans]